jgi:hypothetical protein
MIYESTGEELAELLFLDKLRLLRNPWIPFGWSYLPLSLCVHRNRFCLLNSADTATNFYLF